MTTNPLLRDLFSFIDQAKISGTLAFPYKEDCYDLGQPFAYKLWYTVELTDKLIFDLSEIAFKCLALEKAEKTLAAINLDVLNSAKNIGTAMDRYLSSIREVESKLEYLKTQQGQEIIFNNLEDVQQTPPGNVENLEFTHYAALVEFLTINVLMWLRQNLEDCLTVLRHTSKYSEFLNFLNEKMGIEKSTTKSIKPKVPIKSFEDAVANKNDLEVMIKILLNKKVIDSERNLIKPASLLYSLIKRFKQLGFFKKITMKDLHPLVNTAFKASASYQAFKQTDLYAKPLD